MYTQTNRGDNTISKNNYIYINMLITDHIKTTTDYIPTQIRI